MFPDFDQILQWVMSDLLGLPAGVVAVIAAIRWVSGIVSDAHKLGDTLGDFWSLVRSGWPSLVAVLLGHGALVVTTGSLTYRVAGGYLAPADSAKVALWAVWGAVAYLVAVDWFSVTSGDSVPNALLHVGLLAAFVLFISATGLVLREQTPPSRESWVAIAGWALVSVLWWRLFVWVSGAAFEVVVRRGSR